MTNGRFETRIGMRPGQRPVCHFVMANKGGVGKSTFAKILIELIIVSGQSVHAIDADIDTPDVSDFMKQHDAIDLSEEVGFSKLLNRIEAISPHSAIVVSMPAGSRGRIERYGQHFLEMLPTLNQELGRSVAVTYIIDDKIDSLMQLEGFLASCRTMPVNVVRNGFFGSNFSLFNESSVAATIYSRGGQVVDFPALAPHLMRKLANERMFVTTAQSALPLGDRGELMRWWRIASNTLIEVGYLPAVEEAQKPATPTEMSEEHSQSANDAFSGVQSFIG